MYSVFCSGRGPGLAGPLSGQKRTLSNVACSVGHLQARRAPREAGQDPDGADRRQPVDSRLSRHQAHGLLPRPRAVVPVQPEDHAGVSRHHLRPLLVDGIRHGRRAVGPRRQDQVLAGQHAERVPHALPARGHRQLSRVRGRGRRLRGDDAASHPDAQAAHPRPRLHPADGHRARPAVHGRFRPRHDALHDRPGRESRRARTG